VDIGTGHDPVAPDLAEPKPPGKKWALAIGGLIGVFVVLGAYALISGMAGSSAGTSASGKTSPVPTHAKSQSAASRTALAPNSPSTQASSPNQHALSISAITAFGPTGTSDGDNPGLVSRVIDGGTQPWYSSWYASAEFGNLQAGTGLLLDMGQAVRISSVQVVLGSLPGATVQVRVGDTAALPDLTTAATATNVAGIVQLPVTTKESSRYVLIWFTELPPDGQGKYQVDVYSATVDGTAGT
jgi:hypothetical protein